MNPDLEYIDQGLYVSFLPISKAGETAWREIAAHTDGTGKVLSAHKDSTIQQLKNAGYIVCKAKKTKPIDADKLLKELGL